MKLRIQDNSVRFRVTIKEVEELARDGEIRRTTLLPSGNPGSTFSYAIRVEKAVPDSRIELVDDAIVATLAPADLKRLLDEATEGVYFHFEPDERRDQRFMFFIEKDRPASVCDKPEHWIYEEHGGKPASTREIARPVK